MSSRTVSDAARLAGVTVRTLHHYDQIGLLSPSLCSNAGYRLYTQVDLERLQEFLFYREFGFELAEIGALLDSPECDRAATLRAQRDLLERRTAHLQAMKAAIDRGARRRDPDERRGHVQGVWGLRSNGSPG
ncbi:MAG TPA: MerR family transcriptional regulator [Acidimicrobiia bacterium]|nr:MerR family transcriptional regulator [Acidimicrobiia bacterium]